MIEARTIYKDDLAFAAARCDCHRAAQSEREVERLADASAAACCLRSPVAMFTFHPSSPASCSGHIHSQGPVSIRSVVCTACLYESGCFPHRSPSVEAAMHAGPQLPRVGSAGGEVSEDVGAHQEHPGHGGQLHTRDLHGPRAPHVHDFCHPGAPPAPRIHPPASSI